MFQKLGDALRRFMYGRYGADSLNKWLLIFAVILILLGSLGSRYLAPWMAAFNTLAYVPLIAVPDVLAQHRSAPPGKRRVPTLLHPPARPAEPLLHLSALPAGCPRSARQGQNQYPLPQMRRAVRQENLSKTPADGFSGSCLRVFVFHPSAFEWIDRFCFFMQHRLARMGRRDDTIHGRRFG